MKPWIVISGPPYMEYRRRAFATEWAARCFMLVRGIFYAMPAPYWTRYARLEYAGDKG
jgi:hypothetical protein